MVGGAGHAGHPTGVMVTQGRGKGRYGPQNTRKGSSARMVKRNSPRARNGLKTARKRCGVSWLIIGRVCPASDGCVPEKEASGRAAEQEDPAVGAGG